MPKHKHLSTFFVSKLCSDIFRSLSGSSTSLTDRRNDPDKEARLLIDNEAFASNLGGVSTSLNDRPKNKKNLIYSVINSK